MHWTLPPLLEREVMSSFDLRITGKAEADLRPVNGATMAAGAGAAWAAGDESIEDKAISDLPFCAKLSSTPQKAYHSLLVA